jgi:hypothetical protein
MDHDDIDRRLSAIAAMLAELTEMNDALREALANEPAGPAAPARPPIQVTRPMPADAVAVGQVVYRGVRMGGEVKP